ncbi:MAG: hypothetical protein FJW38_20000 [Acidobacteria bacterium]|nr:hypothetical protein [Acidobacteriota bacterium]
MKGSLQKVKQRGQWLWRVQWRENGKGRTRIIGAVHELSRAEADAARRAIVAPLNAAIPTRAVGVTLAAYVRDEYLASPDWKASTEYTTSDIIERYVLPAIGSRLLAQVTRPELQALLNDLAARLSKSIVDRVRFQLRAIYRLAVSDGRALLNPAEALTTPRAVKGRVAPEVGDRDAISKAIMALPVRERLFLALASWRGMRPGEIAALQVGDIRDGFVNIERRVYRGVIDDPKTLKGRRKVALGSLAGLIDEHVATLANAASGAWLFPSENGKTPITYNNLFRRSLKPVLEAAGLIRFNFQAMRATFATIYGETEQDAKVRAETMGHSVDVHENTYRRTSDEQLNRSMAKLEEKIQ